MGVKMQTVYLKITDVKKEYDYIKQAAQTLASGGVVAIPTETVYGLAASALCEDAVRQIFVAKGRPQDNPLIVHLADASEVDKVCMDVPKSAYKLFEAYSPGPLTVVLKKRELIPNVVSAGLDTIGIRIPSHPVARGIIKVSGVPIAAPSANISGKPSPTTAQHVLSEMDGRIDMIVDGGTCDVGVESTVVSLAGDVPVLLRPGGITLTQLEAVLGHVELSKAVLSKFSDSEKVAAPGMKYRHYAPKAKVLVIRGYDNDVIPFIQSKLHEAKKQGRNASVMCFDGEENYFSDTVCVSYGKRDEPSTLAHNLFDVLRGFDDTDTEVIYARCPEKTGIGLAVYNRLIKAAGFNIIDV
ncbi:MAG: L-threonylcarbamoyladenylate synthase [Bacillota bacterium]|nr:L-threonylcarbamoyladenylate synthase [Bacillota bacterium]